MQLTVEVERIREWECREGECIEGERDDGLRNKFICIWLKLHRQKLCMQLFVLELLTIIKIALFA